LVSELKTAAREKHSGKMIAFLTFSNVINNFLLIASGLLVARWLLPEDLGMFNSFSILSSYIILTQLGIPSGLSRQYPYYLGKNEPNTAMNMASVSNYWSLILGVSVLFLSFSVAIYFLVIKNYEFAAGVFTIGITAFEGFYVTKYLKILYRSNNDFNKLSIITIIASMASFLSIIFVWLYGFYGLCMRTVLVFAINFFFTWKWKPVNVEPSWQKSVFQELIRVGMPIYMVANVYSLWPIVQRTLVLSFGGTKSLGLFGLALMIENTVNVLSASISGVSFPKMSMAWGKNHNFQELIRILIKPVLVGFGVSSGLLLMGWFILPYFIKYLLPNYVEGLAAAQWSLVVGCIAIFAVFSNVYMIIQRNTDRLISYLIGFSVWSVVLFSLYFLKGFHLHFFPQAMVIAYVAIYCVDIYFFSRYNKIYKAG
jgi:O-antigen/teichoic acid export membrane protein